MSDRKKTSTFSSSDLLREYENDLIQERCYSKTFSNPTTFGLPIYKKNDGKYRRENRYDFLIIAHTNRSAKAGFLFFTVVRARLCSSEKCIIQIHDPVSRKVESAQSWAEKKNEWVKVELVEAIQVRLELDAGRMFETFCL